MQAFLLAAAAVSALGVDVGWQQTDNGEMEYIIQLEPHQVKSLKEGDVIEVGVRPDLRNVRRYRIVVGEDELPQESAAPKLTIASPAYSAKPLEGANDFSVVVPKDSSGRPVWSEPVVPPGGTSRANFEELDNRGTDTGSSSGLPNTAATQPGIAAPIDDSNTSTAAANDNLRYSSALPANGSANAAATDETPPPARFIDPPPLRDNPYTAPDAATAQPSTNVTPPANAPANEYGSGGAGTRYPPLENLQYGDAARNVVEPAVTDAVNAANEAAATDPQLGTRYSNPGIPAYNPPAYAGSASYRQPDENLTPPPRPLVDEASQGDQTRTATAFSPASAKPNADEGTTQSNKNDDNESADADSSDEAEPKPWALFTVTLFALFASLGGNLYLGWMNWDMRQRFRSLIRRMKFGDTKVRDSGDGLD